MADAALVEKFTQGAALTLETDASHLTRETHLKQDLNISSIKRFMLMADMEELFKVKVFYAQVNKCVTFGDVLDLIDTLSAKKALA